MKSKKIICLLLISLTGSFLFGQKIHFWIPKTVLAATILNKNVYKTKAPLASALTCTIAYQDDKSYAGVKLIAPAQGTVFSVEVTGDGVDFIRYKEVKVDGDLTYIRFLKGCKFDKNGAVAVIRKTKMVGGKLEADDVHDYIFVITTKNDPIKHYQASSAIIGKLITLPAKLRFREWDNDSKEIQGSFNLSYSFGWRFKIGNHPYHSSYFNIIPYAVGIGAQNYFDVLEGQKDENDRTKTTKPEAQVAFTYWSSGLTYEYDRFNIGLFVGADAMLAPYDNWGYNKKVWYGLGIGYDLFK